MVWNVQILDKYTKKRILLIKRIIDSKFKTTLTKIYDRVIYEQTSNCFESFFNKMLCAIRKEHTTQHASFKLWTSWQKSLDRGGFVCSILIDLSKAYDCLPHDLLLANLQDFGFNKESIRLFLSYLTMCT